MDERERKDKPGSGAEAGTKHNDGSDIMAAVRKAETAGRAEGQRWRTLPTTMMQNPTVIVALNRLVGLISYHGSKRDAPSVA